jgi:hypothetical protein
MNETKIGMSILGKNPRPEEIREIIQLKRFRLKHYFVFSVLCLVISFVLFFVLHIGEYLFFFTFLLGFVGTGLYGLLVLNANKIIKCYWEIDKIFITTTGIALLDYHGKIRYQIPFARVRKIRYGNLESPTTLILNYDSGILTTLGFELDDGKWITISLNDIIRSDRNKIFPYLQELGIKPEPMWRKN